MKKFLFSAALLLGAADAAYASQITRQWYDGQFTCTLAGSTDRLNIRLQSDLEEKPRTCNGDRCSTNGYKTVIRASIRQSRWTRAKSGDYVVDHGSRVTFYVENNNQEFVEFRRIRMPHRTAYRGVYQVAGKTFNLACTRS